MCFPLFSQSREGNLLVRPGQDPDTDEPGGGGREGLTDTPLRGTEEEEERRRAAAGRMFERFGTGPTSPFAVFGPRIGVESIDVVRPGQRGRRVSISDLKIGL